MNPSLLCDNAAVASTQSRVLYSYNLEGTDTDMAVGGLLLTDLQCMIVDTGVAGVLKTNHSLH